ncbi:MAG: hypothetical protein M3004_10110 [Bacteroidota bacterium]|nr:hypothetical protein [Bacteroidota bacterium]
MKVVFNHSEIHQPDSDRINFEYLYDTYAPKAFGFITKLTGTKEQAEEYMVNVFLKVWEDIRSFDIDAEKKIQKIVLITCKSIIKRSA